MANGGAVSARGANVRWRVMLALVLVLALLVTAGTPVPAAAATLTVQSGADAGGTCPGADCTLRQAISAASANDTIDFAPGVTTVTLTTSQLTINKNLTIQGLGTGGVTIRRSTVEGTPNFRIVQVSGGATATLTGLTISNGKTTFQGGGIAVGSNSTLVLTDAVVSGNTATTGGGIYNALGTATLTNTTISNNTATSTTVTTVTGGGIDTILGTLTITSSTISNNAAARDGAGTAALGGGISNGSTTLTILNSTIRDNLATSVNSRGGGLYIDNSTATVGGSTVSGNTAADDGGGIYSNASTLTVGNSTISGNSVTDPGSRGGGLFNEIGVALLQFTTIVGNSSADVGGAISTTGSVDSPASTTLEASIVAGNSAPTGADCHTFAIQAPLVSQGHNVVGDSTGCPINGTGDLAYAGALADLLATTLASNGGPTQTHTLPDGSQAIDRVPAAQCDVADGVDQRGVARPQGTNCDSGAVELTYTILTTGTAGNGTGTVDPTGGSFLPGTVVNLTATPTGDSTFAGWTVDGAPFGTTNPLGVLMSVNRTVIATFTSPTASPSPSPSAHHHRRLLPHHHRRLPRHLPRPVPPRRRPPARAHRRALWPAPHRHRALRRPPVLRQARRRHPARHPAPAPAHPPACCSR